MSTSKPNLTPPMTLYAIRGWKTLFENNRTRDLKRMEWVPIPNKQDGDKYNELVSMKDGPALFGTWIILVEIASKCDPRGSLVRDGGLPHTAESLSRMSRFPVALIARALPVLVSLGWMDGIPQEGAATPQEGAAIPHPTDYGMERNGMERNGMEVPPTPKGEFVRVPDPIKELPEHLNTPRMQNKWRVWMTFRMGKAKVKCWPTLFNEQIEMLTEYDEPTAHEILSASIRGGWQGLFRPKKNYGDKNSRPINRENPRNVGIIRGPTDYGEAARRKLARQNSLAGQVAADENNPPGGSDDAQRSL